MKASFRSSALLVLACFICASATRADVRCPAIFGDHMVLQRDRPVAIWGEAASGESITVEFGGQSVATTAASDGHWRVELAAMPASAEPRTLTIRGANTVTFSDVLVGEVWLCSGQSNMEKQLGPRGGQKPTDNYQEEIRNANYPLLRLYQMPQYGRPQKGVRGLEWVTCTPETVASTQFSAAGYFFGRELLKELKVPIGLIHSSYGGTQIETWISDAAFASHPAIRHLRYVEYKTWVKGLQATELYDSMIVPLVPYTLRGFLWYQGESNCMQADDGIYTEKMRALIDGWREAWHDPAAPFYYVQIAPFDYSKWTTFPKLLTPEELPVFWEAQARALAIPHTGMVATTDLVTNLHDIHPTNKRDVGIRLARLALSETYGRRDILARSPSFAEMRRLGDRIELELNDAGTGLSTRDGKPPSDFVIAGADRRFVPAVAQISGHRVIVESPEVKQPIAVRFGWSEVAMPNLVNSAGLPAIPFRTDAWPVVLERPRPLAPARAADFDGFFRQPPSSAKPWVFWYWMNGAVSREGIAADLAAMREAGIGGAYLMPIKGSTEPPQVSPPVVQLTREWWDCVRFAFAEADRLGLKLAMQDCDGFATAGGPWITPELSMQKVVWSETDVVGGTHVDVALPQPATNESFYRDIAAYAWPVSENRKPETGNRKARADDPAGFSVSGLPAVTTSVAGPAPQFLATDTGSGVFRSDAPCWIQYAYAEPFTCRSITVKLPPAPNAYQPNTYYANRLVVDVSDDGEHFRRVTRLEPPRHGWQDGDADITHAIPATTARYFRFGYDPADAEPGAEDLDSAKWKPTLKLRGIALSAEPRIDGFEGKSGAVWRISSPTTPAQVSNADCVPPAQIVDLTTQVDRNGRLSWEAPPGRWRVLRLGHTSTGHRNETGGGGKGLECDKFNPDAVRLQFDRWFAEAVRQVGPEVAHRVLKVFHVDSWECASQNWSAGFREEFRRRRCYDPLPYLPAMAGVPVESAETSERFLRDVRLTISELLSDNFFGTMAKLAHEHGCEFTAENVAPTMVADGMEHFGRVDIPMGEFWLRSPTHDKLNDMLDAISGARVYGRPVVQAEAFTELSLAWDETPRLVKALQDRNYCLGANRLVFHVFAHNPWLDRRPGMTLGGVGLFFQRDQTWWRPARAWVEYTQRCQALLQQGHAVADIAVFTGEEIPRRAYVPWHLASTLPAIVKPTPHASGDRKRPPIVEAGDWIDPLHGYAYDSINRDALLRDATVKDGRLVLPGGAEYQMLVLPAKNPMSPIADALMPDMAGRLRDFVTAGLTVVLGERPLHSPSWEHGRDGDSSIGATMAQLWPTGMPADGKPHEVGKGSVVAGPYREPTFEPLGIAPDLTATEMNVAGSHVRAEGMAWTHRAGPDWDLYFVSNQQDAMRDIDLSLRIAGRIPELWDPVSGRQREAEAWRVEKDRTRLALRLPASGSMFIVFRRPIPRRDGAAQAAGDPGSVNGANLRIVQTIEGAWTVTFDPKRNGPSDPIAFAQLVSWTVRQEPQIRYYSGTATYRRTFTYRPAEGDKPRHVWLDLGTVRDLAEVSVNGIPCGVAWTPPYRVDVAAALHDGSNELKIDVTNTWFNRLAGDHDLPLEKRTTWTTAPDRTQGKPLLDAGLLGPVTLRVE